MGGANECFVVDGAEEVEISRRPTLVGDMLRSNHDFDLELRIRFANGHFQIQFSVRPARRVQYQIGHDRGTFGHILTYEAKHEGTRFSVQSVDSIKRGTFFRVRANLRR